MGKCLDPNNIRDELEEIGNSLVTVYYTIDEHHPVLDEIDTAKENLKQIITELISQHGYLEGLYESLRMEKYGNGKESSDASVPK